jgi:hypothetical protein
MQCVRLFTFLLRCAPEAAIFSGLEKKLFKTLFKNGKYIAAMS